MITQLQTDYLPRLDGRSLKRRVKLAKRQAFKMVRAHARKLNRTMAAWHRRQYFLSHAYADARSAARANEDIFIATLIIAVVLGYAFAAVATQLLFVFFETAYAIAETLNISMLLLTIITLSVFGVSVAWVSAFIFNSLSTALMQAMTRKKNRSLRATLRLGLRQASRTTLAWAILALIVGAPLMAVGFINLIAIKVIGINAHTVLKAAPFASLAAGAWIIYALGRYSLVPYVVLFEPKLAIRSAFSRSAELVRRKGQLFLLASYGALATALGLLFGLTYLTNKFIGLDQSLAFSCSAAGLLMLANMTMVAFYRKRRLARS